MILANLTGALDGAGGLRLSAGPQRAGSRWLVTRLTLRASGGLVPTARVYRNSEGPASFIDGTTTADANSSDFPAPLEIFAGQTILCVWSLGTVGTAVTLGIEGREVSGFEGV